MQLVAIDNSWDLSRLKLDFLSADGSLVKTARLRVERSLSGVTRLMHSWFVTSALVFTLALSAILTGYVTVLAALGYLIRYKLNK